MLRRSLRIPILLCCCLCCCALPLLASQSQWQPRDKGMDFGSGNAHGEKQWVRMESPQDWTFSAGHPQVVVLNFQVDDGLHVNSHTPHSPYLIPTTLTLDAPAGVHVTEMQYPPAKDSNFHSASKDTLSIYTGAFPIQIHMQAKPGVYSVQGKLRYQACDNQMRICNPPRTLLFTLRVTAK